MKRPIIAAVFLFSVLLLFGLTIKAQQQEDDSIHIGLGFNVGKASSASSFWYGLGLDIFAKYQLSAELSVLASAGYGRLLTKDTSPISDYDFIPLKTAVQIFPFAPPIFIIGVLGAGFSLQKSKPDVFIFGVGTGYKFNSFYELNLKYEGYHQKQTLASAPLMKGQFALALHYTIH